MTIFRLLVWAVIAYIIWRIVRIGSTMARWKDENETKETPIPPFSHIEDADFEDLSPHEGNDKPVS
jgi:hypothetical protein